MPVSPITSGSRAAAVRMQNIDMLCGNLQIIQKMAFEDSVVVKGLANLARGGSAPPAGMVTSLDNAAKLLADCEEREGEIHYHLLLRNAAADVLAGASYVEGLPLIDEDVVLWSDAVVANGGTISTAWQTIMASFVQTEKAAGTWYITDDYWFFACENAAQALTSIKQRRLAVAVNSPTFTPGLGYVFDGLTNYINLNYIASTHAVAMTPGNMRVGVYERSVTAANATSVGATNSTGQNIAIRAKANTAMIGSLSSSGANFTILNSLGFSVTSRAAGSTSVHGYKNGVRQQDFTVSTVGNTLLPSVPLFAGVLNNAGTPSGFRPATISVVVVGAPFTDDQEMAQYLSVDSTQAAAASDPDAWLWRSAVITNGGTVSADRFTVVENFIRVEKAVGTWALTSDYWLLAAEGRTQARTSLKQRRLATAVNSPNFTAGVGYIFDGLTQYLDTGYIPSTMTTSASPGNMRMGVYEVAPGSTANAHSFGASQSTGQNINIRPKAGVTNMAIGLCSTGANFAVPDSIGFSVGSRSGGATTAQGYRNGVRIVPDASGLTVGNTVLSSIPLYIGCLNSSGVAAQFRPCTLSFCVTGGPLNDGQEAATYENLQGTLDGSTAGIDVDALLWRSAVSQNAGTVSATRLGVISTFIKSAKTAGTWLLTSDYWVLWGENQPQALTSLKQRRLATAVNSPTFEPNRGYTFDGLTQYINTNYVPSLHAIVYVGGDMRIAVYERTNTSFNGHAFAASVSTASNLSMRPKANTGMAVTLSSGIGNWANSDSLGFSSASRSDNATTMQGYRNGAKYPIDPTGLTVGTGLPNIPMFIGCSNNNGVPSSFRPASEGLCLLSAPFSDQQELQQYTHVQTMATTIGAQA